jgi:hypothetical protein
MAARSVCRLLHTRIGLCISLARLRRLLMLGSRCLLVRFTTLLRLRRVSLLRLRCLPLRRLRGVPMLFMRWRTLLRL